MIYPWQENEWRQLIAMKQSKRLPHAFMFVGINGVGKTAFANQLAQYLLCEQQQRSDQSCGECHACRMVKGRAHPNVLWVAPEKEGAAIKVDQIREVNEFASQTAMQGDHKFVLISAANQMNTSAANALLKTLEEPSEGTIIVLICDQLGRLPATIASRCHCLAFNVPNEVTAENWLANHVDASQISPHLLLRLANGAPLAALKLIEDDVLAIRKQLFDGLFALKNGSGDPLQMATEMHQKEPLMLVNFMLSLIQDILKTQLTNSTDIVNEDYEQQMTALSQMSTRESVALLDELERLRASWLAGVHLNKQLMLESLFIKWAQPKEVAA